MAKLIIKTGDKRGLNYPLGNEKVILGRDPGNEVVLPDRRISRQHASIIPEGAGYYIEDLGSVNGVLVNNVLTSRGKLKDGDEIKLGSTILVFAATFLGEEADLKANSSFVHVVPTDQISHGVTIETRISYAEIESLPSGPQAPDPQSIQQAYARLRTIYAVSQDLSQVLELPKLLDRILHLVLDATRADRGFIMLRDPGSGALTFPVVRQRQGLEEGEMAVSQTLIQQVMSTGEALLTADASEDQRFKEAQSIAAQGIRSAMSVPLKSKDSLLGIIHVDTQGRDIRFTRQDLELLTVIASSAAVAVENAMLFEDLKQANQQIRERQAQLIEAEKLSALGRLAGGVAHEINNPMTSILGFSGLVRKQLERNNLTAEELRECHESVKIVEEEAHRCSRIAQSLLQFGRRKKEIMAPTDINEIIQLTLVVAKFHIQKVPVEIVTDLAPHLPRILGHAGQLQQVFLNLIVNARDAMENKGGKLTISTTLGVENKIVIKFADTGGGIPADKLEEIFKPLYTTKEEGKGTGLGLSISQEIIELHRGAIDVESVLGQGTTFTVCLPVSQ